MMMLMMIVSREDEKKMVWVRYGQWQIRKPIFFLVCVGLRFNQIKWEKDCLDRKQSNRVQKWTSNVCVVCFCFECVCNLSTDCCLFFFFLIIFFSFRERQQFVIFEFVLIVSMLCHTFFSILLLSFPYQHNNNNNII